jgi:hypothetical protein
MPESEKTHRAQHTNNRHHKYLKINLCLQLSLFCPPLVAVLSTPKFAFRKPLLLIWFSMEIPLFMLYAEKKFIGCYHHPGFASFDRDGDPCLQ